MCKQLELFPDLEVTNIKSVYINEGPLKACIAAASLAKSNKRKVGAVVVDKHEQYVSHGYNCTPDGSVCEDKKGKTKNSVIHAEVVAINAANGKGAKLYVTHDPCAGCLAAIHKAQLEVVVVNNFLKFDTSKLRYDLIPTCATKALAEVLTYGAKKYKPNNWQNCDDISRYIAAAFRHLEAYRDGEKLDPESKLSHLSHLLTNITFLIHFEGNKND